jgi:hypothetical protein
MTNVRTPLIWVLTVVGSAWIGQIVRSWWEAPQPHVELSTVQLKSDGTASDPADVPIELRERIADHIYIPELEGALTVEGVRDAISGIKESDIKYRSLSGRIDKLVELLKTRATTLPIDERRTELLSVWFAGTQGDALTALVRAELARRESDLPERYRRPRDTNHTQWVTLPDGSVIHTAESDEGKPGTRDARAAHNTNLMRRGFEFVEPDVLIPVLTAARSALAQAFIDSAKIASELSDVIMAIHPERIMATVLISNRGGRPLALRELAVLSLRLPMSDASDSPNWIYVDLESGSNTQVSVIPGGEVRVLTLRSRETISELVELESQKLGEVAKAGASDAGQSRLKLLFNGGGLYASVALASAGADPHKAVIGTTDLRQVGSQADDLVLRALREQHAANQ